MIFVVAHYGQFTHFFYFAVDDFVFLTVLAHSSFNTASNRAIALPLFAEDNNRVTYWTVLVIERSLLDKSSVF